MKSRIMFLAQVAAGLVLVLAFVAVPPVSGRQGGGSSGIDRIMRERQRVFNNRKVEEELRKPVERHDPRLALEQIKEDFIGIQVVNKELVLAARNAALDPKFVVKSASEIKKRAERLRDSLVLPEPEDSHKRAAEVTAVGPEQVRPAISALSKLIVAFVNNPVLKEANVIDVELSLKARRDLDEIIELSGRLKRSSEKLNKLAHKSH